MVQYDKRDDFDMVNFPFLDGDVPRRTLYLNLFVSLEYLLMLVNNLNRKAP